MRIVSSHFARLLVLLSLSCDQGNGPIPPPGSQLLFTSGAIDNAALYAIYPDGSGYKRISPSGFSMPSHLRISPDGRSLIFSATTFPFTNADIFRVDKGDTTLHLLAHPASDWQPTWSLDGSRIFFASDRDGKTAIWSVDSDGGQSEQVTPDSLVSAPFAVHSPVTSSIALDIYSSQSFPDIHRLALFDYGTNRLRILTPDSLDVDFPKVSWSPVGDAIAFGASSPTTENVSDLFIVDTSGLTLTRLTENSYISTPSWSPDAKFLAYSTRIDIRLIDVAAGTTTIVVELVMAGPSKLAWSADGRTLAFVDSDERPFLLPQLFLITPGQKDRRRATGSDLTEGSPVWSTSGW